LGACNYETTLRFKNESIHIATNLIDEPWACLLDLSKWELSTPDAWAEIDEINKWASSNNLKYQIIICSSPLQKNVLEDSQQTLTDVDIIYCDNLEQAYEVLESLGFLNI
jgi:hypothetical protein